jgi:8-oxo-dGTP diphosphatase
VTPHIHVACGALRDAQGRVLIVERPEGKIAALKWEFPGGKIEADETPREALDRELYEEIGIRVREARPLTLFTHTYRERKVTLHTFLVTAWDGVVHGREQQRFEWRPPGSTHGLDVLPTVGPILNALCLPELYVFTPSQAPADLLIRCMRGFPRETLVRLRQPQLDRAAYEQLARHLIAESQPLGLRIVLDRGEAMARQLGAAGVHFPQAVLMSLSQGDLPQPPLNDLIRLASCHDPASLQKAEALDLDAAVVGHVRQTPTHAGAAALGWPRFTQLAASTRLPVYAIGGLGPADKTAAFAAYAQGVAGISAYWSRSGF